MKKVVPQDAVLIPDNAKKVFDGVIYDVYQWEQANFDDSVVVFEMLKRPDTVDAICIVDDKVLVLREEQPHRGTKLSLPGGRVDATDESVLAAIKRELKEELGHEFTNLKLVSVVQPLPKLEWFVHTFVAWDVAGTSDPQPDGGERIVVEPQTFEEFKAMVLKGEGFLGESRHIVEHLKSVNDLIQLSEYKGEAVDR